MSACGLDFGTSNTTLGSMAGGAPALLPLEEREVTIPSAIFYQRDGGGVFIGRKAIGAYVEGQTGRLMRSLKSVLGTALVDGELAWRMHSGGHTTGPNIDTFVTWVSRYLKAPPTKDKEPAVKPPPAKEGLAPPPTGDPSAAGRPAAPAKK